MPEWLVPVLFYGIVVLIISALIAEFRGAGRSHEPAVDDAPATSP